MNERSSKIPVINKAKNNMNNQIISISIEGLGIKKILNTSNININA